MEYPNNSLAIEFAAFMDVQFFFLSFFSCLLVAFANTVLVDILAGNWQCNDLLLHKKKRKKEKKTTQNWNTKRTQGFKSGISGRVLNIAIYHANAFFNFNMPLGIIKKCCYSCGIFNVTASWRSLAGRLAGWRPAWALACCCSLYEYCWNGLNCWFDSSSIFYI